jgi:hypothetical protein
MLVKRRNEKIGKELATDQQPQTGEGNQEQEQDECQRNVGPLKLAGRTILLVIQDGIGMEKIYEGDEG